MVETELPAKTFERGHSLVVIGVELEVQIGCDEFQLHCNGACCLAGVRQVCLQRAVGVDRRHDEGVAGHSSVERSLVAPGCVAWCCVVYVVLL